MNLITSLVAVALVALSAIGVASVPARQAAAIKDGESSRWPMSLAIPSRLSTAHAVN